MKRIVSLWACLLVLSGLAFAQAAKPEEPHSIGGDLDHAVANVEKEFVSAAEAMPEDKFSFAPTNGEFKGVRTFGEQVKHVAAVNYIIAAGILGEKPPVDTGGEAGPATVKTKAQTLQFLKDSFAYVHKAMATINGQNAVEAMKSPFGPHMTTRLTLAIVIPGHCFDHYGQMVEYLRMNGIVPPASR
ncbi:MAG TPA: DinB family protein [Terriglobales bacterium]|nr:DinB family protein [Terriglobales bacterium]